MTPRAFGAGALALLATTACPHPARADLPGELHRVLPCRPTIACTADLVPPGVFEIEAGYLSRRLAGRDVQHSTPFLLKLTLATWVQWQVGGNGGVFTAGDHAASYFDDVTVGPKFHLWDQGRYVPAVAVSAALAIPMLATQRGYVATYDLLGTVYVTKDLAWLHVDFNAGLDAWRIEAPALQPWVALALSGDIGRGWGAMVEGYAFADAAPLAPADAGILSAATYSPRPWLMFDAGTDVALVRATRTASFFAGVTFIPYDFWDTHRERTQRAAEMLRLAREPITH